MSKLYCKVTSDSGNGEKTRGGNRILEVKLLANTRAGRSIVIVRLEVKPDGSVVMSKEIVKQFEGFRIAS